MVASAISFFSDGDQVVDVALPACAPFLYTGTATREAAAGITGGSPTCSYTRSIPFQWISSPTIPERVHASLRGKRLLTDKAPLSTD